MKDHIIAGMRDQLQRWEALVSDLSETQLTAPQPGSELSIKDEIAHLMTWQQRSVAWFEAAHGERPPEFPVWIPGVDPEDYGATDRVNAWIYATYRAEPWPTVHLRWTDNFQHLLALADALPERALLDDEPYPWLKGYPLAMILTASYAHHQEHLEKLQSRLAGQGAAGSEG